MQQQKLSSSEETFNLLDELPNDVVQTIDETTVASLNTIVAAHGTDIVRSSKRDVEVDGIKELFAEYCTTHTSELSQDELNVEIQMRGTTGKELTTSHDDTSKVEETEPKRQFGEVEWNKMVTALQSTKRQKWKSLDVRSCKQRMKTIDTINDNFLKSEIQTCMNSVSEFLDGNQLKFRISWKKREAS